MDQNEIAIELGKLVDKLVTIKTKDIDNYEGSLYSCLEVIYDSLNEAIEDKNAFKKEKLYSSMLMNEGQIRCILDIIAKLSSYDKLCKQFFEERDIKPY